MKKKRLFLLVSVFLLAALLATTVFGTLQAENADTTIRLSYDDRKDLSEMLKITVESVDISNQTVTSNAVGSEIKDENVLVYENGTLYAVGTGTATLTVNGQDYDVTVSAAPISLFMIIGHSVGAGEQGNAAESVLCEAGQVYSTYGRGASIDNVNGGLGWGSAVLADAELDAFAPNGGGNIGEGSGIAYEWNRITGEKVWVMNVALGGSCLNEWLPDALNHNPTYGQTSHFNNSVSVFRSAQTVVAAEIAAGHYTLGNMAVIQHTGANFTWYPGWTYEGFQKDYEAIWSGYQEQLSMDMDGDGQPETVEALGFVPYWDVNSGKNYELDKPAGYYMSASAEYPGIFTVSDVYRTWLTDEDVQKNFPEIDYTTQSGVELVKPTSTLHTNKGGSSDNSVYCSQDYAHLSQVAYNAVGQDIAQNLYGYFRKGHEVKSLTFRDTPAGAAVTEMQMGLGESVRLTCDTEPLYGEGVTFAVTDNLQLSYPLCVTAIGSGNGALYAYRGGTLLAQVDIEIINTHSHCVCGGLADHVCETEAWMPWGDTEGEKTTLPIESGNYYLVSDVTLATTASIGNQDVKICLNGHKVESAVKVFWVGSNEYTGGSLTLTDCKDSGTVTVTTVDSNGGGLLRMRPNAQSLNIYGGIYDATGLTTVSANGGLLYLTGGTTNIYGGTFKGGLMKDAGKHGSIGHVTQNAQVNVSGGTFYGGNCSKGGIFEMDSANVTVNVSGGRFTGGNATYGDVFNVANKAILNISGGSYTYKTGNVDTLRSFNGGLITLTGGTFDSLTLVNGASSAYTDILGILGEGAYYTVDGAPVVPTAGTLSLSGAVEICTNDWNIELLYDDRKDLSQLLNMTVESVDISNQTVTSNAVGTQTKDANVLVYENGTLYAVGTGTATLTVNGQVYSVTVSPAPLSLFMITGHSIGMGSQGDGTKSVQCEAGQVYSTYGRGAFIDDTSGGIGYGAAVRADAELDAFAPGGGGNKGEGSGLALQWNRITGEKVWIINAAQGGSCLNEWQPGALNSNATYGNSSHYDHSVEVFRDAQTVITAEIAAGHYTLGNMAILYHNGANFAYYGPWTHEGFQEDYETLWNSYKKDLSMDMDGDGSEETVEGFGIVPIWALHEYTDNYTWDKAASYYMATSNSYPGMFMASHEYRNWLTDEDVVANFPKVDYITQSGTVPNQPDVSLPGTSVDSVFASDKFHLNQIGYNALGQDIAKQLYQYLRYDRSAVSLEFRDVEASNTLTSMELGLGEKLILAPVAEPVYADNITYKVSDNLSLSYPLGITGIQTGEGYLQAWQGDTLLAQVAVTVTDSHKHCVCGNALAGHSCTEEAWMPWGDTEGEKTYLPMVSGNYYLVADVTLENIWQLETREVKICLNGHTITGADKTILLGMTDYAGGSLTITDCAGTGKIITDTVDKNCGGILYMRALAEEFNVYGGTFDASGLTTVEGHGGILCIRGGKTNIYGGTFVGGDVKTASKHGSIGYFAGDLEVNIHGGSFTGGKASKGGIFAVETAGVTLNISGGSFTGGDATYGDIINNAEGGKVNISGGSFTMLATGDQTLRTHNGGTFTLSGGTFTNGLNLTVSGTSTGTLADLLAEGYHYFVDGVQTETTAKSLSGTVTVAGHTDHCVCTGSLQHTCDVGTWKPWTGSTSLPSAAGKYYLTTDVTMTGSWDWNNKEIQLCLNGFTVTGKDGVQTIMLGKANNTDSTLVTKLSICDCKGDGAIQSGSLTPGPVLRIRKDPYVQVDFYSGILRGTAQDTTKNGGAVAVYGGNFNMYGGSIYGADGDSTQTNIGGGAVYVSDIGKFNLYDGTVYGGTDWFRGGAVVVDYANAVFTMYGGTVQGGKATHGNAMANAGDIYIYGGTVDCDISTGTTLQVRENGVYHIAQCSFPQGIRTQNCTLKEILAENSLFADEAGLMCGLSDTQDTLKGAVRVRLHGHCVCGSGQANGLGDHVCTGTEDWTAWAGVLTLPSQSGRYYLTKDVTISAPWDWSDLDITICLNGHTINGLSADKQTIMLGGKNGVTDTRLTITDCTGGGKITSSADQYGAVLRTRPDAGVRVEIYGGSLISTNTAATKNGGAVAVYGGSVHMYGGTLDGFTTSGNGGTVMVTNADSVFALHGGTITGGSAYNGGNVLVSSGTFTMDGGTVCDGIASYLGGNIACSGTANLTGGTICGGTANHGGAVRVNGSGIVNLEGVTLTDNRASYLGGSLSVVGKLNMTAGTVENSTAMQGGILYNNGGTVTVTGGSIRNGTAEIGGLIYNSTGSLTLEGGSLVGGTATGGNGGSIYNLADLSIGAATLTNDTLDNTARAGGVIYSEGNLTLDGATLTGGKARAGIGGTVAIGGGTARISNSTISGGVAGCGSALCLNGGTLTVENVTMDQGTFFARAGQLTLAGDMQTQVTLAADMTDVLVTGNALLDLNGYHVTGANVSGRLQLMDSATDDYQGDFGSFAGTVTGTVEQLSRGNGNTYLTVCTDGVYSAHRYYVGITSMSLKPARAAFGYKAVFCGDETVRKLVTSYGYQLWLDGYAPKTYCKAGSFLSGDSLTLRLQNILSAGNDSLNTMGSTATICGNAVAILELDGQSLILSGSEHKATLQEMVEAVNANASAYNDSQIAAMQTLCNDYAAWMQGWKTENILNWSGQQAQESLLQVGFGRVDITPEESVPLSGYGNTSTRMSNNVLSNLYSTCIAFTDAQGQTILLFHNDLQATHTELYPAMCRAVSEATGVPVENIYVSATHTHSGPDLSNTKEPSIVTYRQQLVEKMAQAAVAAMADRQTAQMSMGATNCPNLNFIRHYLQSDGSYVGSNFGDTTGKTIVDYACQVDDQMQLLRFSRENGKDVVLMNWQMHPTRTGGGKKYDISSDVVGVIRDELEADADCLFAYFTGASGDVNASSRISTDNIVSDYLAHGQALATYALNTLENGMQSADTGALKAYSTQYNGKVNHSEDDLVQIAQVYYDHWTTEHEWDTVAQEALAYGINSGYHAGSILSRSKLPETWDVGLKAFSIGDVAFIMAPYEMFSTTGQNIKENSPFAMTFVVTCANGNESYMPTQEAFAYNCYESNVCKFESGIAEALEKEFLRLLRQL